MNANSRGTKATSGGIIIEVKKIKKINLFPGNFKIENA